MRQCMVATSDVTKIKRLRLNFMTETFAMNIKVKSCMCKTHDLKTGKFHHSFFFNS